MPSDLEFRVDYSGVTPSNSAAFNIGYSLAKPRLRADKDVLAVISNYPQLYNPCNGWNPTPIRIIEWQPSS